ncbi:sulfotransferase [Altererythrobacter aquiaggeris]|uniref:sulfotransferase family protein n=1 Tax=Aestuarierythrobacter aquiaggeris TaxID=1898396 RepID=UPI003019717B
MPVPPRPHPLARAPLVEKINRWLSRAWDKGVLDRLVLTPEALRDHVMKSAGDTSGEQGCRSAEDDADFSLRLEQICAALENEARLNPLGRAMAHGQLTRAIRHRLQLGSLWDRQREIAQTKLAPPILVVGQMRSGTTRLHRLLAADPAHCATRFCDSWHPVPQTFDMRPVWAGLALFWARKLDPWIDALHPFGAARADEELGWLASALDHSAYEAQWHIPSYVTFSEARDAAPIYREFARILATDAAHHGNAHQPRVMKVPQFAEDLGALLGRFPDARVVVSRRAADETVRSAASLVANQMTMQSDHVDLADITREWERKAALRDARTEAALARFGGPVAEVEFGRLSEDWEGEIGKVYAALDLPLTNPAMRAMQAEQERAARMDHADHARQMAGFDQTDTG